MTLVFLIASLFFPSNCDHYSDRKSRFDKIRLSQPLKITHIDPKSFDTVAQDDISTYIATYHRNTATVTPEPFTVRTLKGKTYWVLHCECGYAYFVQEAKPKLVKQKP